MSYSTYLFDFDYTLADSSRGIVTCFRNVLTRHGYTQVTDEEIKRTIGKTLEISFSILTGVTDNEQLTEFRKEYSKEADTHMTINTVLFLETKSVLIALKDAGARIGIISTKYRRRIKEMLEQHFPGNFFDIIIGGEDVQEAKPSPEGLLLAIKQLRVTKAETLYIGDSTVDAETAEAAGVDFAGITHGVTTSKELGQYPHKKIMSTLDELLDAERPPEEQEQSAAATTKALESLKGNIAGRKKKWITPFQILLLLLLLWGSFERIQTDISNILPISTALFLCYLLQTRKILPDYATAFISPWWNPIVMWLRIFHIKVARGRKKVSIDNQTCTCLNCGNTFNGNYCNHCGQNKNTNRYRLNNAFRNIMGGFFNIDSGFGRTLIELLYRPGHMIRDFISGKRVHYFRPFQTLFVLAALYIMCVQLIDPDALTRKENTQKASQQEQKMATANKPDSLATTLSVSNGNKKDAIDEFVDSSSSIKDKVKQRIEKVPFLMKVWHLLESWAHGNKAFRIIATLPLFALATLLTFRRKKYKLHYNFTEHLFVQAYIACQTLLISIIVLAFSGTAQVDDMYEVPLWIIFALFCWDYKQMHRCTWWKSLWSTLLAFLYVLLLAIIVGLIWVGLLVAVVQLFK